MVGRTVNSPSKELANKDTSELKGSLPGVESDKEAVKGVTKLEIKDEKSQLILPPPTLAADIAKPDEEKNKAKNGGVEETSGDDAKNSSSPPVALPPNDREKSPVQVDSPATAMLKSLITVKVKDFVGVFGATEAQVFVLTSDTTFGEFFIDVSCRFNIELGDFDIIYQDKSYSYNFAGFPEDTNFSAVGIVPSRDKVYVLSLDVPHNTRKRKNRSVDSSTSPMEDASTVADTENTSFSALLELSSPKRDFVGLKNRNMTCYLNSFLQGLWFTPEFRNVVYNYIFEPGRFNKKSLCVPLQRLFLQQQFSIRDSIDTDDLIKTFGWEDRETWNQHDIEELCSIFMENLTAEFRGTPMEGLIQALYFGTLDDYVKCLECGRVSQRTDDFLVIPLPIKPFGSTVAYPTLEAALNSFVAYEVLDGNNMYNCGACEKPCPAHKGFKFNRLPYILTIQLKRFEYDFIKDRRLKLNDRVAFPFVLDMNPYIENPSPDRREALKIDILKPASMKSGERATHSRPSVQLKDPEEASNKDEDSGTAGAECPKLDTKVVLEELMKAKGPEIYQLFGVMVHRGGINSGHYYAYIMDFEREKWFRCDDAVVRQASISDIEGAYGGISDDDRELTSAYMLLYRRFDPELNVLPYYLEEMPQHIQEMWKITAEFDQQLHDEEELAKNTIKLPCYYKDPKSPTDLVEKVVQIPKSLNMSEAAVFVYQEFESASTRPEAGNLRLLRYDRDLEIIENSFEGCEEDTIVSALRKKPPVTKNDGLLLELKQNSDTFQEFRADDLVFRAHMVNHILQEVFPMKEVHCQPNASVKDLKMNILRIFGLTITEDMWIVAHATDSDRYFSVVGDKFPLNLFKFEKITNVYVEFGNDEALGDILLEFVEQHTKAEVTQIYIQVPPGFVVKLPEPVLKPTCNKVEPSVVPAVESKDVDGKKSNPADPKDVVNVSNQDQTTVTPPATATPTLSREYFIKLTNQFATTEQNVIGFTLRIDGQTPLYALSKKVSTLISMDEKNFVLYKVDKDETTELRRMTERIATIKPFDRIFVKLEHRLQEGESRIPIYLLNVGCLDKPLEYLTEIVVTLNMTVDEVRSAVMEKSESLGNETGIDKSRIRIRKKLRTNPSKIMRENSKLQDLFTPSSIHGGELYVQILDEPSNLTDKTYCILYRHWHPSTGVLDAAVEITVFHDYSNDLEELILNKLRESLGVGEDVELEAAKPEGGYPWEITPRLIQDLGWFSLIPPAKKSLYVYSDELALFVRDKNEAPMDFDDVESHRPQKVLKATNVADLPRRETGLKINLSKSPSKP